MSDPLLNLLHSEIFITSNSSDNFGTNNNPRYNLPVAINNVEFIKLAEAEIPFTFYTFDASHNTLIVQEAGSPFNVVIPVGNYNSTSIITALTTALNSASTTPLIYTVSISSITGKMTISATGSFTLNTGGTINNLLGLPASSVSATSVVGTGVVTLNYPNAIYLRSNLGSLGGYYSTIYNSEVSNNILARIPMNANANEYMFYQDTADMLDFFNIKDNTLTQMEFYWTYKDINNPDHDVLVDFNSATWTCKIKYLQGN